ncbi:pyridoxamine 5'-phosphate oxidase family protein [Cryptosporangium arvum]|uniref:pyridoxamine 5'-phosphate oxidase family protein n=1 Tax=Cryptosporangium arvum TaxID=80871 RepID=UPI0004AF1FF5|nr:pyridoxamine 5'-phosphate oxidase family protein [Cryptosporangium arvum]
MADDDARTVSELIKSSGRIGMLTTTAPDGTLTSRPMALQEVEFDGDLWFFAERVSRKVAHLAAHPGVNVTVGSGTTWVSLAGTATLEDDPAKKKELWNAGVEAWFPNGADEPGVALIKVTGESAEYWDTPGGRVASLLSFAKAKVTGKPYEGGENETVQL